MAAQNLHIISDISAEGQDCKDVLALHHLLILKKWQKSRSSSADVDWVEGSGSSTEAMTKEPLSFPLLFLQIRGSTLRALRKVWN